MNWIKKSTRLFCLGLILFLCVVFVACGWKSITVDAYDGDVFLKKYSVISGANYNFGIHEKTGYTFLGWYTEKDGGNALTDASGKSSGMKWKEEYEPVIYAHWEANTYTVSFDGCGADPECVMPAFSVVYDSVMTEKLPIPKKQDFSFLGWYSAAEGGMQITDSYGNFVNGAEKFTADVYSVTEEGCTLYARWGTKTVTFIFSTDGSGVDKVTYPVGTVLESLPSSIKDNYCFYAWCMDQTLMTEIQFPYTVTENLPEMVTLYAKFLQGSVDVLQFKTIASSMDREYEVSYFGNAEEIVVPDSYYGKKVTKIKRISSDSLKKIVLPQTVKNFEMGALENCASLEEINIPVGVTVIPNKAFSGCVSLKNVRLPEGLTEIGKDAFADCYSMEAFHIGRLVKTVGAGAFRNTKSLKSFTVDAANDRYQEMDGVLYYRVGNSYYLVQYPLAKVGETYEINSSAVKIMEYAFAGSSISSIVIGGKISYIENGAFENCLNLTSVTVSSSAISFTIDDFAFSDCPNLKALKIELNKIPSLGSSVFEGVADTFAVYVMSDMIRNYQTAVNWRNISGKIYSLGMIYGDFAVENTQGGYKIVQYFGTEKEVVIPEIINANKIVAISEKAFIFANAEKITVSKYIAEIGKEAFGQCSELREIILECDPPELGANAFDGVHKEFGIYIKNSAEVLEAYRNASGWKDLSRYIWSYQ